MAVYITKHGLEILFQLLMNSIIFTTLTNDKMPYIGTTVGTDVINNCTKYFIRYYKN